MVLKIEHIEDGHGYDTRERDREMMMSEKQRLKIFILMCWGEWFPLWPEGHYDDQCQDGALHESMTQAALLRDGPLQHTSQNSFYPIPARISSSYPILSAFILSHLISLHRLTDFMQSHPILWISLYSIPSDLVHSTWFYSIPYDSFPSHIDLSHFISFNDSFNFHTIPSHPIWFYSIP